MKSKLILLLFFYPLVMFCNPGFNQKQAGSNPQKVIPIIEEGQFQTRQDISSNINNFYSEKQNIEILLSPKDSLIQVLSKNLDVDSQEEQIIIVKEKDDALSPIRIILADYDNVRGHYIQAWEGKTRAVNINTYTVNFEDVVGDQQLQIIFRGTNSEGNLTLDIFRRMPSSGLEINYYPICSLVSDGTIDIMETERDSSYVEGYSFGESFPIVIYRTDPESDNRNQIIKETYFFYRSVGRYTMEASVRLSSEKVEESQLNTIISSNKADSFEEHLKGFWYKTNSDEEKKNTVVLFFDLDKREIVFCSGEAQEIYRWKGSKHFYKNLIIFTENELLQSVNPQFTVTLTTLDQINLTISEPFKSEHEQWGGKFFKVKKDMEDSIFPQAKRITEPLALELGGLFKSNDGFTLLFQKPYFTWIEKDGTTHKGGYAVYSFRQKDIPINVLFLKFIIENGLYVNERAFIINYKEQIQHTAVVKTLTLIPAKVSIYGVTEKIEEPIVLIQEAPL
jgi:hypothetical protein